MTSLPSPLRRSLCSALLSTPLMASPLQAKAAGNADMQAFSFAFFGDIPYNALEEIAVKRIYESFPKNLAFAIHIGDIKSGSEECTDQLIGHRFDLLQTCPVPLVMLPGDNEWVDCHRHIAGSFDPVDRLRLWRRLAARDQRANQALSIVRDPEWPELVQWRMAQASASFVGLNIPGSHDGMSDTPYAKEHQRLRNVANFRWLEQAGQKAQQAGDRLLFVAWHADTYLDKNAPQSLAPGETNTSYYFGVKAALAKLMTHYTGQVIVLYGDTHYHHIEHPWEPWVGKRLTSVECFGSPFNGSWLRIDVEPGLSAPRITVQAVL